MADIQNNSTDIPLGAFQRFTGKSFKPSIDFITIAVALNTSSSGTLQFLHSFDDINYFTFGDEYPYTTGSHSRQVSIKGHYFKIVFENGAVPQTSFNLYTRILKQINDDLNVTTKADEDTITVFPPGTGFLSSERDSITIPTLDDCITGVGNDSLKVFVVNQSGGSASNVQIFDSNGSSLLSDGDGKLQVSGSFDVGLTNYALENDGHLQSVDTKLDIIQGLTFLNNKLVVETGITGYATNSKLDEIKTAINDKHLNSTTDSVTVNVISGFATSALQTTANTKLDDIKSAIDNKHLDSTTDSVTVNLITGFATSALQTSTNTKLDTINTTITNKHLDSTTDSVGVTGSVSVNTISGFATSALQTTGNNLLTDIRNKTLDSNSDSVTVFAGGENGLNIRYLAGNVDSVDVGLGIYTWSNREPPFPASRDVLSVQLCGTDNLDGDNLINLVSDSNGSLLVNTGAITITAMPHLNAETDSVSVHISGGGITVNNFPVNYSTETKQDTQIEELQKIVNKTGDITAEIPYSQGASVWSDSTPTPIENPTSAIGWLYQNASTGNAMNLFYFNGNNETKTLSQVVGQYAVVTNLATVLNNKMIFAVYTKSNTSFFTTRITHSPPSNVNMVAGGKYLLYWGDGAVADDIFPNLPRLNFSDITTTGPAVGTEEILSVTLNSDSGASVGSVLILIESLGVVFSNGSVNQSRVYNLITDYTEYQLIRDTKETIVSINGKITTTDSGINSYIVNLPEVQTIDGEVSVSSLPAIEITNTGFDVNNQITNYALEADGNLEEIRNKTDNFNFNDNSGVLELNVFDIQSNAKLGAIETYTSKLDDLTYDGSSNLNVNIAAGSLTVDSVKIKDSAGNNLNSTNEALNTYITNSQVGITGSVNSRTQDASGNNITSTDVLDGKRGLDTASAMFGFALGTTRVGLSCDISGKLNINSYTADGLGNDITSTTTSTTTNSLDTASSIYVSNGTARTALTATGSSLNTNITNSQVGITGSVNVLNTSLDVHNKVFHNSSWVNLVGASNGHLLTNSSIQTSGTDLTSTLNGAKQSLDVNVSNTVPVSGTFFQSTQPVSLKDGSDNLLTSTDTTATQRSLDTASCLYTTDATTRSALTSTAISSIRALDVNVANSSVPVTFSNTTIGISGTATVSDTTSQGYLNTINNAIGESPAVFGLGNLINNGSLTAGGFSTESTFTKGQYRRNTLLFYRDSNISNTGSISVYSSTTSGTPSNILLGTFYPISNGTFRQFTGSFNLLPFASLFIRNDSDTTVTSVFVSYVNG
jgi:hypothetical protein